MGIPYFSNLLDLPALRLTSGNNPSFHQRDPQICPTDKLLLFLLLLLLKCPLNGWKDPDIRIIQ